jgi:WD40 repeat protein
MPRRLLGARAHVERTGRGVPWELRVGDEGQRLRGHSDPVHAVAECKGLVCSGSGDGSIRVWNRGAMEFRQTLHKEHNVAVRCLAVWEGRLVSGHADGKVRAWNVSTGTCDLTLLGHTSAVYALVVSGGRLASASGDRTVRIWAMGLDSEVPWTCERVLSLHESSVKALATWAGKVMSGSDDRSIRVWDPQTGACEARLASDSAVCALAVRGDRVFSASRVGTIQEWAAGTWAALRVAEAFDRVPNRQTMRLVCLAISGLKLISGTADASEEGWDRRTLDEKRVRHEVRVWNLATLAAEHALRQPEGAGVRGLTALGGELWGGVGSEVVVWGRDGEPRRQR